MGTWVFRSSGMLSLLIVLSSISLGDAADVHNFNLTTSQSIRYAIGGARVTFSDLPLGNESIALKCIIHSRDGGESTEAEATITFDRKQVTCRLPPNVSSGKIQVDLEVQDAAGGVVTQVYPQSSHIIPEPPFEVAVQEDWGNMQVGFTWEADYFRQQYPPGTPIFLEATILISDGSPTFGESGIRIPVGLNDVGTIKRDLSDTVSDQISNFRFPYFYVLRPAGTQSDVYLTSGLLTPTLGKTEEIARDICSTWLLDATGPPHPDEIMPCPNCHCKAKLDQNFARVTYNPQILKLAEGRLANHELFYQKVPSPSGHAQTCSYNVPTNALVTSPPVVAGWMNFVSRDVSYVENYLSDIWPYIVCCLQTNSAEFCQGFHERRPVDTGHNYPGPDDPCQGTVDPHMITFDGARYDFQGYGEFWLVHGPGSGNGTFGIQGRMGPLTPTQQVSYFRAVALREGDVTVQIQHSAQGALQIVLNGNDLLEIPSSPTTIPLGDASIFINGGRVEVRLSTGFSIMLTTVGNRFNLYGSGAPSNKGQGYMGIFGNFDGDKDNDLTNRAGTVIPPTAENLRNLSLIHNLFGLSWMTTAEESFFTYEEGLSWESYANPDFGPIMEYPDPSTMPDNVRAICRDNLACYYEYVGTGDLGDAEEAVDEDDKFEELKEELEEEILLCPQVGSPEHGRVEVEGYLNGSVARYSCVEEYDLTGNPNRMCMESEGEADWAGEEPICHWTCNHCTADIEYMLSHDPSDCARYFVCSMGERHFLVCPPDESFNREFLICDKNYECSDPPGC